MLTKIEIIKDFQGTKCLPIINLKQFNFFSGRCKKTISDICFWVSTVKRFPKVVIKEHLEFDLHDKEIEPMLGELFKKAYKQEMQIFASTQSYDLLEYTAKILKEYPEYSFSYTRLDLIDGIIIPKTYDRDLFIVAIEENFEVR